MLVAYNGLDALAIVHDHTPDCIVLDAILPDYSGWEIMEHLRDNPWTAKIPIMMLTVRADIYISKQYAGSAIV